MYHLHAHYVVPTRASICVTTIVCRENPTCLSLNDIIMSDQYTPTACAVGVLLHVRLLAERRYLLDLPSKRLRRVVRVDLRCCDRGMPEQLFHRCDARTGLHEEGSARMTKGSVPIGFGLHVVLRLGLRQRVRVGCGNCEGDQESAVREGERGSVINNSYQCKSQSPP
jgi:hypothetical protein